jgi:nitrite reductase (NADH) large subunit
MANRFQYAIIGNGMAGISAAQELRNLDDDAQVVLIGDEGEPYYYRASLSEWVSGETTDEMLPGRTPEFYDQMRFEQIDGHVTHVDAAAKRIHLAGGETIGYGKTLIATGGTANTFPVEGLDEVQVFRTLADARTIKERLGDCGQALIMGGGILGLELAGALFKMGQRSDMVSPKIGIVQRSGFVGKPFVDAPAAEWLQERLRADGIELFLEDTVERVEGQTAHLTSGRTWDFDLFVQAVGTRPVYPEVPGLTVGRGIQIDAYSRTNLPDIFAAGDCTETRKPGSDRWMTTRIWLDCARQARVAACRMTGGPIAMGRAEAILKLPFLNCSIIYTMFYSLIGEPHGEDGDVYLWQEGDGYRKFRVVDGRLAGALLLGQRHGTMAIFKAVGQPVSQFGADIARPDFPWNELGENDWDYYFY